MNLKISSLRRSVLKSSLAAVEINFNRMIAIGLGTIGMLLCCLTPASGDLQQIPEASVTQVRVVVDDGNLHITFSANADQCSGTGRRDILRVTGSNPGTDRVYSTAITALLTAKKVEVEYDDVRSGRYFELKTLRNQVTRRLTLVGFRRFRWRGPNETGDKTRGWRGAATGLIALMFASTTFPTTEIDVCVNVLIDITSPVNEYRCGDVLAWPPDPLCGINPLCCTPQVCKVTPVCGLAGVVIEEIVRRAGDVHCFRGISAEQRWQRWKDRQKLLYYPTH